MSELSELADEERAEEDIKITLDTLQGWWENMSVRTGMVLVKHDAVFIRNKKRADPIQIISHREVRWGQFSGIVKSNRRVISWSPGNITWSYIGKLPDQYDAETDTGRWQYDAFLGKGAHGCVYAVEEARRQNGINGHAAPSRKLALKVLRSFCDDSKKRNHEDVFKLHQEFQWSHLLLHNKTHEHYHNERASLIVEYLEDHTGFPSADTVTVFTPDVAAWLKDVSNFSAQPYVVMEYANGTLMWDVLSKHEQRLTFEDKGKIMQQTAMALDYMAKFNLAHRDLRLHNMLVSRGENNCKIKILDLGRVASKTVREVFSFSPRDEAQWRLRDWIPWEEWVIEGKPKQKSSYSAPSFDIFSMGVILLYLCVGQAEARNILDECRKGKCHLTSEISKKMVLDGDLVLRMVSKDPTERPEADEILSAFASKRRKLY